MVAVRVGDESAGGRSGCALAIPARSARAAPVPARESLSRRGGHSLIKIAARFSSRFSNLFHDCKSIIWDEAEGKGVGVKVQGNFGTRTRDPARNRRHGKRRLRSPRKSRTCV